VSNLGYSDFLRGPRTGPGWVHGPWWQKYWKAIGSVFDAQNDLLRAAQSVRNPDGAVALGMSDALDEKGRDLMLPRGGSAPDQVDESDASYAARLKSPWTTWGQDPTVGGGAGSIYGILTQLEIAGFPIQPTGTDYTTTGAFFVNHLGYMWQLRAGALLMAVNGGTCVNRTQLDGTLPVAPLFGWTLDARDQFYSHWMLLFVEDVPTLTNEATCAPKARLNEICKRWKSGSAHYCGAAIVPAEDSAICWGWPLTTKWGDTDLKWGTNGARFIDPE
jgi:hypothetical protein